MQIFEIEYKNNWFLKIFRKFLENSVLCDSWISVQLDVYDCAVISHVSFHTNKMYLFTEYPLNIFNKSDQQRDKIQPQLFITKIINSSIMVVSIK